MKRAVMNKSKVIFLSGPPASGKTTVMIHLKSRGLPLPAITKDDIKERLFAAFNMNNQDHGTALNQATLNIMFDQLEEHLRAGKNLMLEANFKPVFDQQVVERLYAKYKFDCLQIILECPGEELLSRDTLRRAKDRQTGHSELDPQTLTETLKLIKPFNIPSEVITLDSSTNPEQVAKDAQWQVEAFISE